jgi:hypothetical protein
MSFPHPLLVNLWVFACQLAPLVAVPLVVPQKMLRAETL